VASIWPNILPLGMLNSHETAMLEASKSGQKTALMTALEF
jgi:hypothetical protein